MKNTSRTKGNLDFMEVFKDSFSKNVEDILKGKIPKPPNLMERSKLEQRRNGTFNYTACLGKHVPGEELNLQTQFVKNFESIKSTSSTVFKSNENDVLCSRDEIMTDDKQVSSACLPVYHQDICEEINLFDKKEDLNFIFQEKKKEDDPNEEWCPKRDDEMDLVEDDDDEVIFDDRPPNLINGKDEKIRKEILNEAIFNVKCQMKRDKDYFKREEFSENMMTAPNAYIYDNGVYRLKDKEERLKYQKSVGLEMIEKDTPKETVTLLEDAFDASKNMQRFIYCPSPPLSNYSHYFYNVLQLYSDIEQTIEARCCCDRVKRINRRSKEYVTVDINTFYVGLVLLARDAAWDEIYEYRESVDHAINKLQVTRLYVLWSGEKVLKLPFLCNKNWYVRGEDDRMRKKHRTIIKSLRFDYIHEYRRLYLSWTYETYRFNGETWSRQKKSAKKTKKRLC